MIGLGREARQRRVHALRSDMFAAYAQQRFLVRRWKLRMAFDAEHRRADFEHCDRAVRGARQQRALRRHALHLVGVHVLQIAVMLQRLHPWLGLYDRHVEHTDAPALLGFCDVTAERLREHLVAEAHAHEGLAGVVNVAHESLQRVDPRVLVVHREPRAGAEVDVARIRRRGDIPPADVEAREMQVGNVRAEQCVEHVLIAARDVAEALGDVVAGEQADVHGRKRQTVKGER